jgi:hypothetical protein
MTGYGGALLPLHIGQLVGSGISEDVARERGYVSVDTKRRLDSAGFKHYQQRIPGLLIPVHDTSGAVALWQYRPDKPRASGKTGKPVKYETPGGSRMVMDVPPRVRAKLGDPKVPLWVTEGVKKADAAVSAGLCCVALLGVWNWKGTNTLGGKTALPAFHDIAWNDGRRVYVAYDSDVMTNPKVHWALADIGGYLAYKGADVRYVYLPAGGDDKVGLDDYLAAGGSIDALITSSVPQPREPERAKPLAPPPQPVPAPVPVPADPAALLDEVHDFLCAYVVFPSAAAAVAATLWAAHTHLVGEFESTPRLALLSPEKQCGKSRVLELLELLCAGAETLSDASPAYLYRRIGAGKVTILLDEADAIWKRGKTDETAEALRSVVNAGHRRSATVGRVEMNGQAASLTRFKVYAPAAIAGIGGLPDTIMDRAVVVRMRRRAPGESVRDYRERTTRPEGEALRGQLAAWAADVAGRVGDPWPDMPPGVADRAADVWESLLMVADLAEGDWPKRAAEACTAFVTGARDDTGSTGTRLLADLRDVFGDAPQLFTQTILDRLHGLGESPWADYSYGKPFSARDLADMLKEHQVKSHQLRIGEDSRKGYRRADLEDTWARYLPSRDSETAETSETPLASNVSAVSAVSPPRQTCAACGEPLDPALAACGETTHPMCDPEEETAVKLSSRPRPFPRPKPEPTPRQCRICLLVTDDLHEGVCRDRAACEARQPTLPKE